jgi:leucyl-tRNA synthetase
MAGYDFAAIEKKWQDYWEARQVFRQSNPGEPGFVERPRKYVLDMFPYPSGAGLHVGHPEGYTATDIICRHARMTGHNVLHPMGYDSFGLPAEQYAVEHGVHPRETTARNIENIERQIRMFGFSYDWSRRVATTDVEYYRWTQWIFLKMFNSWYDVEAGAARPISELIDKLLTERLVLDWSLQPIESGLMEKLPDILVGRPGGTMRFHELDRAQQRAVIDEQRLAYMAEVPVNWCPKLGTVLANEEVTNEGRSERGNYPVYRRALKQWMLRITAYAERLEADLDALDWPEPIKIMQRNWIGKSTGAEVDFPLAGEGADELFDERASDGFPAQPDDDVIRVYTTRPDTLFGATYMVLAPEHPLVRQITTPEHRQAVLEYVEKAVHKSDLERTAEAKEKTGVFTGAYAVNPVNRQDVPIWVADYVLMGYGTGAIMAVPAHDERDFEFAKKFGLQIHVVVLPSLDLASRIPIPTSYHYDGPLGDEPSPAELDAINRSIVEEFNDNVFYLASAPEGHALVMSKDGRPVFRIAGRDLAYLKETADPEAFRLFAKLLRQRAQESQESFIDDGFAVNSGDYDGLATPEFKKQITEDLETAGLGRGAVNYKLRDWLFSRQRYWGEPFPIVHCDACGGPVALPENRLPLVLPEMADFSPESSDDPQAPPKPPLGKAADWVLTTCPSCGGPATRELNTMPQWAGSCWYYLRYLDSGNARQFCDRHAERYWLAPTAGNPVGGVDLYVGGAEHAVLHLLYARFWHKVLYDLGCVSTSEPFARLFNQGMILSFTYRDARGVSWPHDQVDLTGETPVLKTTGEKLAVSVEKMSKSLRNVVTPDDVIRQYGADTFRLYEMFMGPLDASKPWNTQDVPGVHRFLNRVGRMIVGSEDQKSLLSGGGGDGGGQAVELEKALHRLTKKVGEDIVAMKFNTAIAAMMEFINVVYKAGRIEKGQAERFVLLLAPFAPHIAEELWQQLGHDGSLAYEPWPAYDESMLAEDTIELPVQVNGKLRARVTVPAAASQDEILRAALAHERIAELVQGKEIVKRVVVPGKLVSIVVK